VSRLSNHAADAAKGAPVQTGRGACRARVNGAQRSFQSDSAVSTRPAHVMAASCGRTPGTHVGTVQRAASIGAPRHATCPCTRRTICASQKQRSAMLIAVAHLQNNPSQGLRCSGRYMAGPRGFCRASRSLDSSLVGTPHRQYLNHNISFSLHKQYAPPTSTTNSGLLRYVSLSDVSASSSPSVATRRP
jgi:hypothetical protein